ncbi:LysM peptidoglycan-binding domain-containing protein [Duganella sp. S19_KUP01_CR8]|uniref:LysM peptidoglycan-binding domain-containing protein n=1 Tax=Duganella sp. S19_KUP01_CR8 TaxID=3025502 RepID=UPI002FCD8179
MANTAFTLTLGSETFQDFEIPESIPLGGSQKLVVHQLPGGVRVVQAMGAEDDPIQWSGLFLGANALQRARAIDLMRVEGSQQQLSFFEYKYRVVVKSFKYVVEQRHRVRYTLELDVVEDSTRARPSAKAADLNAAISADAAKAGAIAAKVGDPKLTGLMKTMNDSIKSVSDFVQAGSKTINGVLEPVRGVATQVKGMIAEAGAVLQTVTTLGGILPNNPVAQQAAKLTKQLDAAVKLPDLHQLQAVVGRIEANLTRASGAVTSLQKVVVGGDSLYRLAAKVYGDATKWIAIAQANKVTDPQVTGVRTLAIPATPPDNGGVPGP